MSFTNQTNDPLVPDGNHAQHGNHDRDGNERMQHLSDQTLESMTRAELIQQCKTLDRRLGLKTTELKHQIDSVVQFIDGLAHDIKSPWRAISGFTEFLKEEYETQLDETAHTYIDQIVVGMERMNHQFAGLQQIAKAATRKMNWETVCLDSTLQRAIASLSRRLQDSDANVTSGPLPRVQGDSGLLCELFEQLIDNAVKFMGDRQPEIKISAIDSRDAHTILVSDRGTGMSTKELERVFRPFRSEGSQSCKERSGTGLSVCRKIVDRHHGKIWIESNDEKGVTVKFTIPKSESEHDPPFVVTAETLRSSSTTSAMAGDM